MISLDRLIFAPTVTALTGTFIINPRLEDAILQMNGEDIAETPGTPLNNLTGRVMQSGENTGGNGDDITEFAGRQCYRSWSSGREASAYIENILSEAHGSVFEHSHTGFQITGVSRSLTHELIRHSVGTGVSQESQRFVDASEIMFVVPPLIGYNVADMTDEEKERDVELCIFRRACEHSLNSYIELLATFKVRMETLIKEGASPASKRMTRKRALEAARSLLSNAAETRLFYTTNLRALRHIILQRGVEPADLEIRRLAVEMLREARAYAPFFFQDMKQSTGEDGLPIITPTWGRC